MRNKIWLVALALLVAHSGEALANTTHSASTTVTQQTKAKKQVSGVVSDDLGPIAGVTVFGNYSGMYALSIPPS